MKAIKMFRVYRGGLVDLESVDVCLGQIYELPNKCDGCGTCGVRILEFSFFDTDACLCPSCLRVLADAVEDWQPPIE